MKTKAKRFASVLVSLLMAFSLAPATASAAYADEDSHGGRLVAGANASELATSATATGELPRYVLGKGVNTPSATSVIFGGKKWRVIGYDGRGVAQTPGSGTMTLLLDGVEDATSPKRYGFDYAIDSSDSNHYSGSNLQNVITGIYKSLVLSETEKTGIVARDLLGNGKWGKNCDAVADGQTVTGQKLWPLSTKECFALNKSIRTVWDAWWLRSPGQSKIWSPQHCLRGLQWLPQ